MKTSNPKAWDNYLGFYSSWLGGYFREPWAMMLPMDDHGFHRGDAVFEAARIYEGAYIDLQAHLARLARSAKAIGMTLPKSIEEIESIVCELAKRCGSSSGLLRLYVTRGPGGFSPSPAEVIGHQIYAAITKIKPPEATLYADGVKALFCETPAKEPFFAQIKSCNYLQNVLMKMESNAKGFDFPISITPEGKLCEGATENLMILTKNKNLVVPRFDYTLRGTTVSVVMRLAEQLKAKGEVSSVSLGDISREDLLNAEEAAFVGTTLAVLPIGSIDNKPVGKGRGGQVMLQLNTMLLSAMASDPALRTAF
ncbi:MAG: aminotransferase class IV [Pseudobdellovibrionaceae bacterium]